MIEQDRIGVIDDERHRSIVAKVDVQIEYDTSIVHLHRAIDRYVNKSVLTDESYFRHNYIYIQQKVTKILK